MRDLGISAAVFALVAACSNSNTGTVSNPYPKCERASSISGGAQSQACTTCIDTQCAGQMNQFYGATGCKAYLDCACSDGGGSCVADITPACEATTATVLACIQQHCPVDCGTLDAGAIDGASMPGDAGATGTLTANCQALSACCATIATASAQTSCNSEASLNVDTVCSAALAGFADAGVCP